MSGALRQGALVLRGGARLFLKAGAGALVSPRAAGALLRCLGEHRRGLLGLLHLQACTAPERIALVCGDERVSYGALEARVNQLTHGFAALGVGPRVAVAALLHNSPALVEAAAAVAGLGGVVVPVGYRLKGAEVAHVLGRSQARALLFEAELAPVVEDALGRVPEGGLTRDRCFAVGQAPGFPRYDELARGGDPARPRVAPGAGPGGIMIFTSGTTGPAKGASREFGRMGLAPILDFMGQVGLTRDERHLVVAPLYHAAAAVLAGMVLGLGGRLVLVPRFDPEEVLRVIEREAVTSALLVPTMYTRLLALGSRALKRHDVSSLRALISGAAPLSAEEARRIEDAFGPVLFNFYGATETGLVSIARPGEHTARPGTIGRPIAGVDVRLLDPRGADVPQGEPGELFVRSPMAMDGYHRDPAATRAATREGYVSVGDLARRDPEGYLYLVDRKSDLVISGGVNIYPWEIEQRLLSHPAVEECAVVGVPDPEWGEAPVAFVVPRGEGGRAVDKASLEVALIAHVKEGLADFKRPRRVLFVGELPRTPTGKVQKRALRARLGAET